MASKKHPPSRDDLVAKVMASPWFPELEMWFATVVAQARKNSRRRRPTTPDPRDVLAYQFLMLAGELLDAETRQGLDEVIAKVEKRFPNGWRPGEEPRGIEGDPYPSDPDFYRKLLERWMPDPVIRERGIKRLVEEYREKHGQPRLTPKQEAQIGEQLAQGLVLHLRKKPPRGGVTSGKPPSKKV